MNTTASPPTSPLAGALRASGFVGRLVEPADPDYDTARAGWNGAIDRRPAAVAFATRRRRRRRGDPRRARRRPAVHDPRRRALRLRPLGPRRRALHRPAGAERASRSIPRRAIVRVGGGALLGELDAATQEHGLAVPAGQISHTGVGGLTLGGGIGWLMRHHGLTIDSLLAAEVVLADGQHRARARRRAPRPVLGAARRRRRLRRRHARSSSAPTASGRWCSAGMLVYPWEQAREAFRASRDADGRTRPTS